MKTTKHHYHSPAIKFLNELKEFAVFELSIIENWGYVGECFLAVGQQLIRLQSCCRRALLYVADIDYLLLVPLF
jgi:hypothetical protein